MKIYKKFTFRKKFKEKSMEQKKKKKKKLNKLNIINEILQNKKIAF